MNGSTWQVWLGSIVIAALVAALGRIVEWPKNRGEGNKADAEGNKADAEARQIVEDGVWRRANDLIARAEAACGECRSERERIEKGFKKFIGVMDELAAQFADPADRAKVRTAIREAWEAL